MATISDLPHELLHHILECIHEDGEDEDDAEGHSEMLRTLASASLVARHWRYPAQSLMWSLLLLSEIEHVEKATASASLGQHRTKAVVVQGFATIALPLAELITRLEGVEQIGVDITSFFHENRWWSSGSWLESPRLQGLQELQLDTKITGLNSEPLRIAFHLTSLILGPFADMPSGVLEAILDASASTLTFLSLGHFKGTFHPSITKFLSHSGANLETLNFNPSEIDLILPHAPSFTSLTSLPLILATSKDIEQADELLRLIPTSVEELEVQVFVTDSDDGQGEVSTVDDQLGLLRDCVGRPWWSGLGSIDLTGRCTVEEMAALPQGSLLIKMCEEKEIVLYF